MEYEAAIVRGLSKNFANAIQSSVPDQPINVEVAIKQHRSYVEILKKLIPKVIELPADDALPDCCFIEDTAIIVGVKAVVSRLGALNRRGEEKAVQGELERLNLNLYCVQEP